MRKKHFIVFLVTFTLLFTIFIELKNGINGQHMSHDLKKAETLNIEQENDSPNQEQKNLLAIDETEKKEIALYEYERDKNKAEDELGIEIADTMSEEEILKNYEVSEEIYIKNGVKITALYGEIYIKQEELLD